MSLKSYRAGDIASLLMNDVILIRSWERFYHFLDLSQDNTPDLQAQFNQYPKYFPLIKEIILQWANEKGDGATISALAAVLIKLNHIQIRDDLVAHFEKSARIISISSSNQNRQFNNVDISNDTNSEPTDAREYANEERQRTTAGPVTVLELLKTPQHPKNRIFIFISHLLRMLKQIGDLPVAIISINGKQRMGKSFMATQFIKYLKFQKLGGNRWLDEQLQGGFEWRSGLDRVTSGVQIWYEPIIVNCENRRIGVLVIDTQGLYDRNTGIQENAIIFGFSVLLSSVFIYNDKSLADDSLKFLHSFLEFAKFASSGEVSDYQITHMSFQNLVMLLRDWEAEDFAVGFYTDDHTPAGQTLNLKNHLFNVNSRDHSEAKRCREGITNCFENIAAYAMHGPGNRKPDKPEYKQSTSWDTDFRNSVIDFVSLTLSESRLGQSTKKILGSEVTGSQLTQYVSRWVRLISEADGMVESRTLFETTANIFYSEKVDVCMKEYKERMRAYLNDNPAGVDDAEYNTYHATQVSIVGTHFCEGRFYGGVELRNVYLAKLREQIFGVCQEFVDINMSNVAAEHQRGQREETKRFAIINTREQLEQCKQDLELAKQKRESVVANQNNYGKEVLRKERNDVAGVTVSPSYSIDVVHDPAKYQTALSYADLEIKFKEERVASAEANLLSLENM